MLYLILAAVGGGKTRFVTELIGRFAEGGREKLTLIVPEQFSFTSEKTILCEIGARKAANVDVVSFTSLGEKILENSAPRKKKRLDDSTRAALMSEALDAVSDKLEFYGRRIRKSSAVKEFLALGSEFKRSAVSTDSARAVSATLADRALKTKLSDITTILDAYDALVERSYFDPDDLLTELYDALGENDYFKDAIVFIDGFRGFTAREYKIVERALRDAKAVYATLCADSLENARDETDLFAHTKRTARRLIDLARKNGASVAKPQYLSMRNKYNNFPPEFKRYDSPELAALEKELFSPAPKVYEEKCDAITLCKAADIYKECEFVACEAKRLIREEGYRRRDIAVIARDSADYEPPLKSAFKKCGISVFEDSRRSVNVSPVVGLTLSAVRIASRGFKTEDVASLLKTELAGFDEKETADAENYCYLWKINGSAWTRPWEKNPGGFGEAAGDEEKKELEYLNEIRRRIVSPLQRLEKRLRNAGKGEPPRAVFEYMERINAAENLRSLAKGLLESGETGLAMELDRMWNVVMDVLENLEILLREKNVSPREFYDLLELTLGRRTVGDLPRGLDEITIGSADRIRIGAVKAAFIVGVNDGEFPASPAEGSALTENDRKKMREAGLELSDCGEYALAEERLIAYCSFCRPSERLYVCRCERGPRGEARAPSELYLRIGSLFPRCVETDPDEADELDFIEGEKLAFERAAKNRRSGGAFYATVEKILKERPGYSGRFAALERAAGNREFKISSAETAEKLFGSDSCLSASRAESYYKCPFAYFCKYGIKAEPRAVAELDPLRRGSIIHFALERLLRDFDSETLLKMSGREFLKYFQTLLGEYLDSRLDGAGRSARFVYIYNKLALSMRDAATRLVSELSQCDFKPADFEVKIGGDGDIPAYEVETDVGKTYIYGAVDRVDEATINGGKYIRIIDYKSSGKAFSLSDAAQGLNMQMFIYLFALWKNGVKKYGEFTPAGVLYYSAKTPLVSAKRNASPEEIDELRREKLVMNGVVLDDPAIAEAMDRSKSGRFVPVKFTNGVISGSLVGLKQLEKLKEKTDSLLADMAKALRSGDVRAVPAYGKNYKKICEYCDYKAVCSYESDIPVRRLKDEDLKTALKNLEKGENDDGMDDGTEKSD